MPAPLLGSGTWSPLHHQGHLLAPLPLGHHQLLLDHGSVLVQAAVYAPHLHTESNGVEGNLTASHEMVKQTDNCMCTVKSSS